MRPKKHRKHVHRKDKHTTWKWKVLLALGILIIAATITYLVWPFNHTLTVTNTKGAAIVGDITVVDDDGELMFKGTRHVLETNLWKGTYNVTINSTGYEVERFQIVNNIGLKINKDINETKILTPRNISLTLFSFFDPTTTLELGPKIKITGKNILGNYVEQELLPNSTVMYGDYTLQAYNDFFEAHLQMEGDSIIQEGKITRKVVLHPNDNFFNISSREADNTMNFLADYIDTSQKGLFDGIEPGLPKQFYLYKKDTTISLGKMLFLFCEKEAYNEMGIIPDNYFIPKEHEYWTIEAVSTITECYERTLIGAVPQKIGENHLQKEMSIKLLGKKQAINYKLPDLNTEIRGPDIAFTFDIESGRYIFDSVGSAVSPCESDEFKQGLSETELVCNRPEFVAWMTPLKGPVANTEYNYPHVSGITGYKQILDYPGRYGIPITNFYVKKDLLAYEELSPDLAEKTRELVNDGLIEVGSHTLYHTNVALVDERTARNEMKLSREFLASYFNTTVVGFRAPYNVMMSDEERHAKALSIAGYEYFSQFGKYNGDVPDTDVEHKQWNADWQYISDIEPSKMKEMVRTKPYLITLDHPWNLAYDERIDNEGYYLTENPALLYRHRANVLTAIANGGRIVTARELNMRSE